MDYDLDNPEDMPQSHMHVIHSILASKMELRLLDVLTELLTKLPANHDICKFTTGGGMPSMPRTQLNQYDCDNLAMEMKFNGWPNRFQTLLDDLINKPFLNLHPIFTDSNITIVDLKHPGHRHGCVRFFYWPWGNARTQQSATSTTHRMIWKNNILIMFAAKGRTRGTKDTC
eukprot:scaffold31886_cov66-Attheya_sp.AAC.9